MTVTFLLQSVGRLRSRVPHALLQRRQLPLFELASVLAKRGHHAADQL